LKKEEVAIKVPLDTSEKKIASVKFDKECLEDLYWAGVRVPEVKWYGTCKGRPVLVMELLGVSLHDVWCNFKYKINLSNVLRIAVDLLEVFEGLHDAGILHRDIKMRNLLLGPKNDSKIYLIDYGLSKKWRVNGRHIKFDKKTDRNFGSVRCAPVASHQGQEQGRKDDLESLGFLLIHLASKKLPWSVCWHKKRNIWWNIVMSKKKLEASTFCKGLPSCFEAYMNEVRALNFEDKPNYTKLRKLFLTAMHVDGIDPKEPYVWENKIKERIQPDLFSASEEESSSQNLKTKQDNNQDQHLNPEVGHEPIFNEKENCHVKINVTTVTSKFSKNGKSTNLNNHAVRGIPDRDTKEISDYKNENEKYVVPTVEQVRFLIEKENEMVLEPLSMGF